MRPALLSANFQFKTNRHISFPDRHKSTYLAQQRLLLMESHMNRVQIAKNIAFVDETIRQLQAI
jgi:hypothetical protein